MHQKSKSTSALCSTFEVMAAHLTIILFIQKHNDILHCFKCIKEYSECQVKQKRKKEKKLKKEKTAALKDEVIAFEFHCQRTAD